MGSGTKVLLIGACGYIGSGLYTHLLAAGHDVAGLDRVAGAGIEQRDYRDLAPAELARFDVVVWLAGHSSVPLAAAEPAAAIENNVSGLLRLAQALGPHQRLIYASSAALYSGSRHDAPLVSEESIGGQFQNAYDLSKFVCDTLMPSHTPNFYALRFGTVCGTSKQQRHELLLNAMVRSAVTTGTVRVSNAGAMRSILAMNDLLEVVERMLATPPPPGYYNLGSHSMSIGAFGSAVADQLGVSLAEIAGTPTYSFTIDSTKLRTAIDRPDPQPLPQLIEELARFYGRT